MQGTVPIVHRQQAVSPERGDDRFLGLRHDRPPPWVLADPPWNIEAGGGLSHHRGRHQTALSSVPTEAIEALVFRATTRDVGQVPG